MIGTVLLHSIFPGSYAYVYACSYRCKKLITSMSLKCIKAVDDRLQAAAFPGKVTRLGQRSGSRQHS